MSHLKEIFARTDMCTGCQSCRLACAVAHSDSKNLFAAIHETPRAKSRVYVEWLDDQIKVPVLCRHCEDAPCINACIAGAITRSDDNTVITNDDKCIGCWTCVMVCPYGVIGRDKSVRKAYRCDRCPDLEIPACVSACPTEALIYQEVDQYSKSVRKNVARELVTKEGG
ncbi:MAG: 4Fe-4S dicluster domain-containing protein [Desulfobacteraceae bacterium]|nr:MAG: 4Fe-4S dicluster domain-containing protein [Desulfobacteraceae bacterium]